MNVTEIGRRYGAAVVLGIVLVVLGVFIALLALLMALDGGDPWWLALLLPALALMVLGAAVRRARVEGARSVRPFQREDPKRRRVQDYAHRNKAWDNVSRWRRKYGGK